MLRPRVGGQYAYLRDAYHPMAAFLYGWTLLLVIQTGGMAGAAIIFGRYFRELLRVRPLDPADLTRTLALATGLIESDFELSQTLRVAAPAAALETSTAQAYVDAANDVHSDFERRRALRF